MQREKIGRGKKMKTYTFKVIIEEDPYEDRKMAYHVHCPALEEYGASTLGLY
jgi:hypothetical protein